MSEMNKPVAIVLGGTLPHCELIRQMQERGFYVILVDYLANPPARAVADEHIQESTMDPEKVLEIARERKARAVVCGCVDQANITACYVMEQLGQKPPYSYDTAVRITNKGDMKRVMLERGIPTSRYVYIDKTDDVPELDLRYPLIVKPADGNSSNGVKKADNPAQMEKYLSAALSFSRNHRAIVEEFVVGREISAYCFIRNHRAKLLMTAERLSVHDGENRVIKCYASIAPARISKKAEQRAEEIATMIAEAYGLDNTPLFFQGMVRDDEIYVIEFAPRVAGGSSFKTIKGNTGFDIISATIDSWLGIPASLEGWHAPSGIYVVNTVYGKDGEFSKVTGSEELLKKGVIEDLLVIRAQGDVLDNGRAASSRVCFFLVKADSEPELLEKVRTAYQALDVVTPQGESLIRKDLSLEALWKSLQ